MRLAQLVPLLPTLLACLAIPAGAQQAPGSWSTPVDAAGVATAVHLRGALTAGDGSLHHVVRRIGFGAPQLQHLWRSRAGVWQSPINISDVGSSMHTAELPLHEGSTFFMEGRDQRLHLIFRKFFNGATRLWHRHFDLDNPGAGWSSASAVSVGTSTAQATALLMDDQQRLHLMWREAPVPGTAQLWHAHWTLQAGWDSPQLVSTPGAPSSAADFPGQFGNRFLLQGPSGSLHAFFMQALGLGPQELWHRSWTAGAWSAPRQVSGQGTPAAAVASAVDAEGRVHAFWRAIDGLGAPQLWNAHLGLGDASFSTPENLSLPGSPSHGAMVAGFDPVKETPAGDLVVAFDQLPSIGTTQAWLRRFDATAGHWTSPEQLTTAGASPWRTEAIHVDRRGGVHHLASARDAASFTNQIWHTWAPAGSGFVAPVRLSSPGHPNFGANLAANRDVPRLFEDAQAAVHVVFEQVPSGGGAARVWHTHLHPDAAPSTWEAPLDLSGPALLAPRVQALHVDDRAELHVVYAQAPAPGTFPQLWHARRIHGVPWTPPTLLSTPGLASTQARIPEVPWDLPAGIAAPTRTGYAYLDDDDRGTIGFAFEKITVPGSTKVWSTEHERIALTARTGVNGPGDLFAAISRIPAGTTHGFTALSITTPTPPGGGNALGVTLDSLTQFVLATPAAPGNPLHWTWPVAMPLYPAAPFALPPGSVVLPVGTAMDLMGVAIGPGVLAPTNVVRLRF